MEVLFIKILMLTCYGIIASAAIHETKGLKDVLELKNFFIVELHEIENRFEENFEALRDEMMQNNKMLRKTVDELNTKLESERREKSDAIQQLEKQFSEKDTKLMVKLKDLKNQLLKERNDRNREVGRLKAVIVESMPKRKTDSNIPKEKGDSDLTTESNRVEDTKTQNIYMQNKEETRTGNIIFS